MVAKPKLEELPGVFLKNVNSCALLSYRASLLASLVALMVKNRLLYRRPGFSTWVGKIPWRRAWQPTPVFLPGESPWTEKSGGLWSTVSTESDKQLSAHCMMQRGHVITQVYQCLFVIHQFLCFLNFSKLRNRPYAWLPHLSLTYLGKSYTVSPWERCTLFLRKLQMNNGY